MGSAKKSPLKLITQSLIVFAFIAAVMYFMGLSETFEHVRLLNLRAYSQT